ncbi:MAG: 3'-5' exonuclease [Bacteroides sp.]|nr:3'-5' exonuclease [Prevotella sp.]MCM1407100.1 3'-5' exonuclease [Treponema brennaborense]MCM1470252.1 3'-5' exonuclease [Bacteroides sp.]
MRNYKYLAELFASGMEFTAVDTETTGLHLKKDRIIEIGAVRFNKDGIISRFGTLVQPPRSVSPNASKVNGITDDMLLSAPAAEDVLPAFMNFTRGSKFAAHNAGFDISFLNKELTLCGMEQLKPPAVPAADTLFMARKLFPGLEKYTQAKLAEHFLIPVHHAHRAEDDARVCMEIFLKIIAAVPIG